MGFTKVILSHKLQVIPLEVIRMEIYNVECDSKFNDCLLLCCFLLVWDFSLCLIAAWIIFDKTMWCEKDSKEKNF